MSAMTDTPARRAYDKLKTLSADEEARRLAFVRERALPWTRRIYPPPGFGDALATAGSAGSPIRDRAGRLSLLAALLPCDIATLRSTRFALVRRRGSRP